MEKDHQKDIDRILSSLDDEDVSDKVVKKIKTDESADKKESIVMY